jgi:hypothetical protein
MTVEREHQSTARNACRLTHLPQMKHLVPWQRNLSAAIYNGRPSPRGVGRRTITVLTSAKLCPFNHHLLTNTYTPHCVFQITYQLPL